MKQIRLEAMKLSVSLGGDCEKIIACADVMAHYIETGSVENTDPRRIKRKRNQKEKTNGSKT